MAPTGHLDHMAACGIDMQCISPRPFQMMHSERPAKIVHYWTEVTNDVIHKSVELMPDKFYGVAGLPQAAGEPIVDCLPELERCVKLGFKGALINPDPYENGGVKAPPMGDRYWYPLYEKLCELDVVGHIHATGSREPEREPYTLHFINEETTAVFGLVNSSVLDDFPSLKILVSHGGGAIPFQLGRFDAASARRSGTQRFRDRMRRLYYDTVLYTPDALELLIKSVGVDRVLFGAECPGVGSSIDPDTGRTFDDIVPHIRAFDWLSDSDQTSILELNARNLFKL
jgi:predicted TIM-barrel fold metal-dependent hydrolase